MNIRFVDACADERAHDSHVQTRVSQYQVSLDRRPKI